MSTIHQFDVEIVYKLIIIHFMLILSKEPFFLAFFPWNFWVIALYDCIFIQYIIMNYICFRKICTCVNCDYYEMSITVALLYCVLYKEMFVIIFQIFRSDCYLRAES